MKRKYLLLGLVILITAAYSGSAQKTSTLEKIRELKTPILQKRVAVYYSRGYKARAEDLHSMINDAIRYYEKKFAITLDLSLAVLSKSEWEQVTRVPYGLPFASDPPYVVFLPATEDGLLTTNIDRDKKNADVAHLLELRSLGFEYEAAAHKGIDLIGLHEVGHVISENLGIGVYPPNPNKWVGEFLASYFAYAYLREKEPKLAKLWLAISRNELATARQQKYTRLADFEEHYSSVGPENYGWFQSQFVQRIDKVTEIKGLTFAADLRANPFPEKRNLTVDEVLMRLEKISPGFIEWAKDMR